MNDTTYKPVLGCAKCKTMRRHNLTEDRDHFTCSECNTDRHFGGAISACHKCPPEFVTATLKHMRETFLSRSK